MKTKGCLLSLLIAMILVAVSLVILKIFGIWGFVAMYTFCIIGLFASYYFAKDIDEEENKDEEENEDGTNPL